MRPSFVQIAIVILIIVIIFGAPKLPQLARSLGQSMKIFKSEIKDLRDEDEPTTTEPGELNRDPSTPAAQQPVAQPRADGASEPGASAKAEQPAQDRQDPQSHEK
ncbi:Sec-independent protein translocase subunit TatA [Brevibacterium sp. ZH18]|uniref:Sec-independent protein translocase subunit TatA n=1 Tax=Brevibacterium sp. ZH18 TaxID=2927784 RepID=UPI001F6185D4|nr:Sec-independent protein translocase subunit TatA [Brevibacterium sp. ZH18]MCI4010550.1 Sec-independent protein translocase subunit TatA [Brevibacterium sp. ZH18]